MNLRIEFGREYLEEAVFEGAVSRLRPVLMTATFLTLFVLPVLFASFSEGKLRDMRL